MTRRGPLLLALWIAPLAACGAGGFDDGTDPPATDDDSASAGDDDTTPHTGDDDTTASGDDDTTAPSDDDTGPVDGDGDGFTPADGDCNDTDPSVYPGAAEDADGVDDDCDGTADDGTTAYDDDGDGYTEAGGDCDDTNANTWPGSTEFADGADNDCDGSVDEDTDAYDDDGDGLSEAGGDCDDDDATVFPGGVESADGADNDCDGLIDEGTGAYDDDGDGWTEEEGDCNDAVPSIHPNAPEDGGSGTNNGDGVDNNCNGYVDDGTLQFDDDGDGYSDVGGDCDDFDPLRAPGFTEDPSDGIDNDCDGTVDELPVCDCPDTSSLTAAIELCDGVVSAVPGGNASSRLVTDVLGTIDPRANCQMAILSTGIAGAADNQEGHDYSPVGSSGDTATLTLQLQVPETAGGFSFQFYFLSTEYPEWVGSPYNDKFTAVLDSGAWDGNVSFDEHGNQISINSLFFDVTSASLLVGTGFGNNEGGGTGWLTTTAPCVAGEVMTLTFSIGDVSDGIYDSAVVLDNFRWVYEDVGDPNTG